MGSSATSIALGLANAGPHTASTALLLTSGNLRGATAPPIVFGSRGRTTLPVRIAAGRALTTRDPPLISDVLSRSPPLHCRSEHHCSRVIG